MNPVVGNIAAAIGLLFMLMALMAKLFNARINGMPAWFLFRCGLVAGAAALIFWAIALVA